MGLIAESTGARQARRRRWIERHACQELLQELATGRLPFRTAHRLAHLPRSQQRREAARRKGIIKAQELAADTINKFLARPPQQPENYGAAVAKLCGMIVNAIASGKKR